MNRRPRSYQERALPLSYLGQLPVGPPLSMNESPDICFWWRGQDSNLRSPSGRQIYSLVALTTHPPLQVEQCPHTLRLPGNAYGKLIWIRRGLGLTLTLRMEPQSGFEPLTCRLQVDCASIAPQGPARHRGLVLGIARALDGGHTTNGPFLGPFRQDRIAHLLLYKTPWPKSIGARLV